jgi:hypothetical protein
VLEGKTLAGAVVLTAAAVFGLGMVGLYAGGPPPPPERPPPPPPPETLINSELRFSPVVYRGQVEKDARALGVPLPEKGELEAPFLHVEEITQRRALRPGAPLETTHLRLTLGIEKRQASVDGQQFAFDHLVLRIENRTDKFLAYRIVTELPGERCTNKGDVPHNAIVLEPRQTISRTECLRRRNEALYVKRVEVMELPPLSAYYVARLPASTIFYEPRTSAGHVPLKGRLCPQTFSWREIQDSVERKEIGWRDVIDFYARHNCEEYAFFRSYRFRTDPAARLPARPQE